jgi:hypothetical protein
MRGGEGPPGAVSIWSWSPLFLGRPLNLSMTSSPAFVSVGILIANPSGRLFHSMSSTIFSLVVPALCFLSSASVRG